MKRLLALVPLTLLVLSACSSAPTGTAGPTGGPTGGASTTPGAEAVACADETTPGAASVAIIDFAFEPETVSISAGQAVTFSNTGQAPHTVTFDDGPDCGRVAPGSAVVASFSVADTYAFHCEIHPEMEASITVNP